MKLIVAIFNLIQRGIRGFHIVLLRSSWRSVGKHVRFSPGNSHFTYGNISIGNDVYIGPNAMFLTTESTISIGNKVMFGPGVTIITGDHNYSEAGIFMKDNLVKMEENDQPVIIEDDVWIGTGVIILKGVRIHRGSIVAAGSLVIRDVLPYSIVAGHPARFIKGRFNADEILMHEKKLYDAENRLSKAQLSHLKQID